MNLTSEQIDLIIKLIVAVVIIGAVLWVITSIRRKIRRLKNSVGSLLSQGMREFIKEEGQQREQRLSTLSGSSEVQGSKSDEVRVALREQQVNCPNCGGPNTGVEAFCTYCKSSLIKSK